VVIRVRFIGYALKNSVYNELGNNEKTTIMKKIISLICAVCFYNIGIAQDYTPMLEIGKIWYMRVTNDTGATSTFQITATEIVQINGVDYFHLEDSRDNCDAYLRDDIIEKKVYGFLDNEEFLLFDFTLEVGDYININGFNFPITSIGNDDFFGLENLRFYELNGYDKLIEGIGLLSNGVSDGFRLNCIFFPVFEDLDVINMSQPLDINDVTLDKLSIYPNPVVDNLQIEFNSVSEIKDVKVYSILGKLVLSPQYKKENNQIDVSSLNNGIYFLKIETEIGYLIKKIIKTTH
jgi:hypothetical protein